MAFTDLHELAEMFEGLYVPEYRGLTLLAASATVRVGNTRQARLEAALVKGRAAIAERSTKRLSRESALAQARIERKAALRARLGR